MSNVYLNPPSLFPSIVSSTEDCLNDFCMVHTNPPGFEPPLLLATPFSDFAPASEGASDGAGKALSDGGADVASPAAPSPGGPSPGACLDPARVSR